MNNPERKIAKKQLRRTKQIQIFKFESRQKSKGEGKSKSKLYFKTVFAETEKERNVKVEFK